MSQSLGQEEVPSGRGVVCSDLQRLPIESTARLNCGSHQHGLAVRARPGAKPPSRDEEHREPASRMSQLPMAVTGPNVLLLLPWRGWTSCSTGQSARSRHVGSLESWVCEGQNEVKGW